MLAIALNFYDQLREVGLHFAKSKSRTNTADTEANVSKNLLVPTDLQAFATTAVTFHKI